MKLGWSKVISAFSLLLALGCESTGVGNPFRQTSLEMVSSDSVEPDAVDPAAGLPDGALEHAVLVVGRLELEPCEASGSTEVVHGPFVVDLVTGEMEPRIDPIATPEGGFCSMAAFLAPAERPASLLGRSIFLSGQREDGVKFLVYAEANIVLRVLAREGESFGATDGERLFWAFRPRRWLERAEVDGALVDSDSGGQRFVIVDANRHPLLYEALLLRIGGRSGLYRDLNESGVLDVGELTDGWVGIGLGTVE
jgi:hypothetical protein